MISAFGHDVEITEEIQCQRSNTNHKLLASEARTDRINKGFDIQESYVLCTYCRKAYTLKD